MAEAHEGEGGWARWSRAAALRPWTVGIEEEVMLLDPRDWSPANQVGAALGALTPAAAARASYETHACVLELKTAVHATVGEAVGELEGLRRSVASSLRAAVGLRVAAAGTHPLATAADVTTGGSRRCRQVTATMRDLARREPTMAQHVHVSVPSEDMAVRALDGLRSDLPLLLALSANSPYWCGHDSGFASMRIPVFGMFPRSGPPPHFGTYDGYVAAIDPLVRSRAIPEPSFVWWDARLRPRLGTVEVRIMDAQSRTVDTAALAALVQCLVHLHAGVRHTRPHAPAVLEENRFLAARDGMRARLLDEWAPRGRRGAGETLDLVLEACGPVAELLRCAPELAGARALAADPGDVRQRRLAAAYGLRGLIARLSAEFDVSFPREARSLRSPTGTSALPSRAC